MVDAAVAVEQKLVDIGRRLSAGIVGAHVAFLVAADANAAAARTSDVAGRERNVHQRAVGMVVVVAPDQALLVGEHSPSPRAAVFWFADPFRGLAISARFRPVIFAASSRLVLLAATPCRSIGRSSDEVPATHPFSPI